MSLKEGLRVIITQLIPQGETHTRVKLYSEEGIYWATVFGARSTRISYKRHIQVLSMGAMSLSKKKGGFYTIQGFELYESCYELSRYYRYYCVAHALLELALLFESEENVAQFRSLVSHMLKLVSVIREYGIKTEVSTEVWFNYFPLIVYLRFLLQGLVAHGVHAHINPLLASLNSSVISSSDCASQQEQVKRASSSLQKKDTFVWIDAMLQNPILCGEISYNQLITTLNELLNKAQAYLDRELVCASFLLH